jgi:hypothetical protein
LLVLPVGFNLVPSIPDAQSLRCLFYPNGHNNEETLNLALIWPYDDPPTEFLAMKDPAEMTEWLQKRLPWLELTEAAAKDILEQRVTTLRMVRTRVAYWMCRNKTCSNRDVSGKKQHDETRVAESVSGKRFLGLRLTSTPGQVMRRTAS